MVEDLEQTQDKINKNESITEKELNELWNSKIKENNQKLKEKQLKL